MNHFPTHVVHPSRPLQLEPTGEHGDRQEILVYLDEPVWSVRDIMRMGKSGIARRTVALKRFMSDRGAPSHARIVVFAVDADAALKAYDAQ